MRQLAAPRGHGAAKAKRRRREASCKQVSPNRRPRLNAQTRGRVRNIFPAAAPEEEPPLRLSLEREALASFSKASVFYFCHCSWREPAAASPLARRRRQSSGPLAHRPLLAGAPLLAGSICPSGSRLRLGAAEVTRAPAGGRARATCTNGTPRAWDNTMLTRRAAARRAAPGRPEGAAARRPAPAAARLRGEGPRSGPDGAARRRRARRARRATGAGDAP